VAGFKAALVNELYKLLKKKKMIATAVLSLLVVLIGQLAVTAVTHGLGLRLAGSAEFPFVVMTLLSYTLLPLFAAFVAIDAFCGEFSSNTMKLTLTRPVSRFGVYSAKVGTVAVFIVANLLFVMILALLAGFLFNPQSAEASGIVKVVLAYVVTGLPLFVFALVVVVLANLLRSGTAVFFLSVLLYLVFHFLGIVFSRYASFFVTSSFDWYTLWIADAVNWGKILRQLLILLGCGMMLFTAGYYLFERKDL